MAAVVSDAAVPAAGAAAVDETTAASSVQSGDSSSSSLLPSASSSPTTPTAGSSSSSSPAPLSPGDDTVAHILKLKKALDDGLTQTPVDPGHLLSVLQELSGLNGVINTSLLSQTHVGHVVNRLTRLPAGSTDAQAAAVRDSAKAIIAQWKDKVKTASTAAAAPTAAAASTGAQSATAVSVSSIVQQLSVTVAVSSSFSSASSPPSSSPTQPSSAPPVSPLPLPSATRSVTSPSPAVAQAAGSAASTLKRKSADGKPDAQQELKKRQLAMKEALHSSSSRSPPSNVKTDLTPSSPPPPSQPSPGSSSPSYQLGKHADATRNKIQRLLFEAIGGSAGDWETELAVRMEQAMFELFKGDTSSGYRQKYRELAMNLRDPLNPDINSALLCGAWQPETVVAMSVKELASSSLKAQREAEARWAREEARSDLGKLNGLTDMFRCGKCRERKCTYYQMQTRSADEPMTVFVRCTVCGNRWKM